MTDASIKTARHNRGEVLIQFDFSPVGHELKGDFGESPSL